MEEDLRRGSRLPLGQAGRPELPRPDLRHPDRRQRTRRLQPDLVPPQRGLTGPPRIERCGAALPTVRPSVGLATPPLPMAQYDTVACVYGRVEAAFSRSHPPGLLWPSE